MHTQASAHSVLVYIGSLTHLPAAHVSSSFVPLTLWKSLLASKVGGYLILERI